MMKKYLFLVVLLLASSSVLALQDPFTQEKIVQIGAVRIQHIDEGRCWWDGIGERSCEAYGLLSNTGTKNQRVRENQVSHVFRGGYDHQKYITLEVSWINRSFFNHSCVATREATIAEAWALYSESYNAYSSALLTYEWCQPLLINPGWYDASNETLSMCASLVNGGAPTPPPEPTQAVNESLCTFPVPRPVFENFEAFDNGQVVIPPLGNAGIKITWQDEGLSTNSWNLTIAGVELDPDVSACFTTTGSGLYNLTQDIEQVAFDNCIVINHDNVVLECNNYRINASLGLVIFMAGVFVNASDNVTVQNCEIGATLGVGDYAVHVLDSVKTTITNLTVIDSFLPAALYFDGMNDSTLTTFDIHNNSQYWLGASSDNTASSFNGSSLTFFGAATNEERNTFTGFNITTYGNDEGISTNGGSDFSNEFSDFILSGQISVPSKGLGSFTGSSFSDGRVSNYVWGVSAGSSSNYTLITVIGNTRGLNLVSDDDSRWTNMSVFNSTEYDVFIGAGTDDHTFNGLSINGNATRSLRMEGGDSNFIDCAGGVWQSVQQTGALLDYRAAHILSPPQNTTLTDCIFRNYSYGVYEDENDERNLYDHLSMNDTTRPIYLFGSDNSTYQHHYSRTTGSPHIKVDPVAPFGQTSDNNTFTNITLNGITTSASRGFDVSSTGGEDNTLTKYNTRNVARPIFLADQNNHVDCTGGTLNGGGASAMVEFDVGDVSVQNCIVENGTIGFQFDAAASSGFIRNITITGMSTRSLDLNQPNWFIYDLNVSDSGTEVAELTFVADSTTFDGFWINGTGTNRVFDLLGGFGPRRLMNTNISNGVVYSDSTIYDINHNNVDFTFISHTTNYCSGSVGADVGLGDNTEIHFSTFQNCTTGIQIDTTSTVGTYNNNTLRGGGTGITADASSTGNTFNGNYGCENTVIDFTDADANTWTGNQCNSTGGNANCASVPFACPVPITPEPPTGGRPFCYGKEINACRLLWFSFIGGAA